MPTQQNILVWLLMPSYSGKSILRKSVMSSTSNSGKCILFCSVLFCSELSLHNKLILYKQVIHPVWSYCIQLWGCASDSNIEVIERCQNKVLKCIVNAPLYVWNSDLHRDLRIETVKEWHHIPVYCTLGGESFAIQIHLATNGNCSWVMSGTMIFIFLLSFIHVGISLYVCCYGDSFRESKRATKKRESGTWSSLICHYWATVTEV
jgi:hypothetical protein